LLINSRGTPTSRAIRWITPTRGTSAATIMVDVSLLETLTLIIWMMLRWITIRLLKPWIELVVAYIIRRIFLVLFGFLIAGLALILGILSSKRRSSMTSNAHKVITPIIWISFLIQTRETLTTLRLKNFCHLIESLVLIIFEQIILLGWSSLWSISILLLLLWWNFLSLSFPTSSLSLALSLFFSWNIID
jgi:hypothetical protein